MALVPLESYRDRLIGAVGPLRSTQVPVAEILAWQGLVLAEDLRSQVSLPGFDNSSMDGYAVCCADLAQAPAVLPVSGDIPAGDTRDLSLEPGRCWRIMTGARLPAGADAVVPVEQTDGGLSSVRIAVSPSPGDSIRRAGDDVRPGDLVVPAGTRLDARHTPVVVSSGGSSLRVVPRPRVAIVSTGDELRSPGSPADELAPGLIVDSNGPMLAALVRQAGFEVAAVLRCGDTGEQFEQAVRAALASADAVVTSGGVSAGAFEPVKSAAQLPVEFTSIAMQPGKPQGFGIIEGAPLFALPGNPVSSLVSFVLLVAPALRVMAGRPAPAAGWRTGTVAEGWTAAGERAQAARVRLQIDDDRVQVRPAGGAGSHLMGGLAGADALAMVPAGTDRVEPGDRLPVLSLTGDFS